ncbi:hypothetical protein N5D45_01875 [Stenotrophomonas sp. GD03819]|uniref:hypothetical protein n=1 Tax=Stenotrophomonas sp. GD03819 TaxID=2975384 RepID=UPI00244B1C7D|nr:hypothetical protein [Stenotrophomonas sp. GD03819]MDH1790570.1 hypothetical protein [Stenotrophomonas sp. GD03819]
MNRSDISFRNLPVAVKKARSAIAKGATAVGGLAMSGIAFAQDSGLGAAATAEVGGIKTDVTGVLKVLIGVCFLLVAFTYLKRAK